MENITNAPVIQKHNISDDLIVYIKEQILSGELNPGDRIIETKLAKELNISQTPVREAIRHLQGEGILVIFPNKGPLVRTMDLKDVFEIYSVRSVLEGLAIRIATQNASDGEIAELEAFYNKMKDKKDDASIPFLLQDSAFIHQKIFALSNHSRLISMYKSISFQIALVNRMLGTKSTKQKEIDEHWELIEALKKRDPDHAEKTIRKHIYRSYRDYVEINEKKAEQPHFEEKLWL